MKKALREKGIFILICAVLGIILGVQFKTATYTSGKGINPREREKELVEEYDQVLQEKERLEEELGELEGEIVKHQEEEKRKNKNIELLYDELDKHRMFVGFDAVEGRGISIELNEPSFQIEVGEDYSIIVANYDLILQLISKLNDLGAEAISINGERYTNYTSLVPEKNSIKVNDISVYAPFNIDVIGDQDRLEKGLNVRGSVMWNMQNKYMYQVKIEKKDKIQIKEYGRLLKLDYAKPVENQD